MALLTRLDHSTYKVCGMRSGLINLCPTAVVWVWTDLGGITSVRSSSVIPCTAVLNPNTFRKRKITNVRPTESWWFGAVAYWNWAFSQNRRLSLTRGDQVTTSTGYRIVARETERSRDRGLENFSICFRKLVRLPQSAMRQLTSRFLKAILHVRTSISSRVVVERKGNIVLQLL